LGQKDLLIRPRRNKNIWVTREREKRGGKPKRTRGGEVRRASNTTLRGGEKEGERNETPGVLNGENRFLASSDEAASKLKKEVQCKVSSLPRTTKRCRGGVLWKGRGKEKREYLPLKKEGRRSP